MFNKLGNVLYFAVVECLEERGMDAPLRFLYHVFFVFDQLQWYDSNKYPISHSFKVHFLVLRRKVDFSTRNLTPENER